MLVSAITPTADRKELLAIALRCFEEQAWPEKEMIVVDNGREPVFSMCYGRPDVTYVRVTKPMTIGALRNLACEHANGDIIAHFDDDDWSDPRRLDDQVGRLLATGLGLTGYDTMLFWSCVHQQAFAYDAKRTDGYAVGSSMCYRTEYWRTNRFPDSNDEDNDFANRARHQKQLVSAPAGQLMVCRLHGRNTSNKFYPPPWPLADRNSIPAAFFQAIGGASQ